MIDAVVLRKQVRVVLSTRGEAETLTEGYIHAALSRFFPERVEPSEMQFALNWNQARGYVEKLWNADEERHEWKLSKQGRVKEGV